MFVVQDLKLYQGCWVNYCKRIGIPIVNLQRIAKYVQHFSKISIGHYQNLKEVSLKLGVLLNPHIKEAIMNLILTEIDNEIQDILKKNTYNFENLLHHEKIGLIGETNQAKVESFINSIDWEWLHRWIGRRESIQEMLNQLSSFAYPCKTVNFRTSYHCNSECKFCYNFSSPLRKNEFMPINTILEIIEQMPEIGIKRIIVSGGEPFLYLDNVLKIVKHACENDVKHISILSNGFWGSTYDKAKDVLLKLKDVGYNDKINGKMKVSNGVFHQEFVKIDGPLNIAKAHYDIFKLPIQFDYEIFPKEDQKKLIDILDKKMKEHGLDDHMISVRNRRVLAIGRALDHNIKNPQKFENVALPCLNSINKLIIEPDNQMTTYPCCGQNYQSKGLAIGYAKKHNLKDLVKLFQNDSVSQFIVRESIDKLFDYVPGELEKEYSSKCNICFHALSKIEDKEPLLAKLFNNQRYYPYWFQLNDGKINVINHFPIDNKNCAKSVS